MVCEESGSMDRPTIGYMTLVHRRHQLLPLIVEQAVATWPSALVDFGMDRPSPEVSQTVGDLVTKYPDNVRAWMVPVPAISHRENFMVLRQLQLERMHQFRAEFVALLDDDHIFSHPEEAAQLMNDGCDLIYTHKVYLWGSCATMNLALPGHCSVTISRRLESDAFGGSMVNAPDRILRDGLVGQMRTYLLDVGYLTEAERKRVWEVYKRAGKIDPLTLGLNAPPRLFDVTKELAGNGWYKKLKDVVES
jgi:hypothetical protein